MAAFPPHVRAFAASPERSFSEANSSQDGTENRMASLLKIVRAVEPNLSPDIELGDLHAAEQAQIAKDSERGVLVDKAQEEVRQLRRQYAEASTAAQRPSSHPSAAEFDAQVRSLEQQQYATVKQLNEEQALVAKKEAELSRWKGEQDEVGKIQVGEDNWEGGKIIRLKLLSEAGFSLVPPKDGTNSPKILIRNDAKEDVHSVPVDTSRSKAYTANLIWSLAD